MILLGNRKSFLHLSVDMIKPIIAIFNVGTPVEVSPSILNLLDLLSRYYHVHFYTKRSVKKQGSVFTNRNTTIINIQGKLASYYGLFVSRLFYMLGLYEFVLSIDPYGFQLSHRFLPQANPFYYSLELYQEAGPELVLPESIAAFEKEHIHSIRGLIIQSPEREAVFRSAFVLSRTIPTLLLPVTYTGPSVLERKKELHAAFNLPPEAKIAVHIGGIAWFSWCIELARAFSQVPNWYLVFHGYAKQAYLDQLTAVIRDENIRNVLITNLFSPAVEGMYPILQSGDVGVAWYESISPNMHTAAKSSGKISAYMKFGLPVITKRNPSAMDAIDRPGCGISIDGLDLIQDALDTIDGNYDWFSRNARIEYERAYRFENYHAAILDFFGKF